MIMDVVGFKKVFNPYKFEEERKNMLREDSLGLPDNSELSVYKFTDLLIRTEDIKEIYKHHDNKNHSVIEFYDPKVPPLIVRETFDEVSSRYAYLEMTYFYNIEVEPEVEMTLEEGIEESLQDEEVNPEQN